MYANQRNGTLARTALQAYLLLMLVNLIIVHGMYFHSFLVSPSCTSTGKSWAICIYYASFRVTANTLIFVSLTVVVVFSYALFLRYREFYADQVAVAHGCCGELRRLFTVPDGKSQLSPLQQLLAFHPTRRQRASALSEPFAIFSNSKWLLLLVGVMLGASRENIKTVGPIYQVLSKTADYMTDMVDSQAWDQLASPPRYAILGVLFAVVAYVGLVSILRVGARNGLIAASTPERSWRAGFALVQSAVLFIVGHNFIGPVLAHIGGWMARGFPPNLLSYLLEDLVPFLGLVCVGLFGSALAAYLAGRIFHRSYRPRITIFFAYCAGWELMNFSMMVIYDKIPAPENLSKVTALSIMAGLYLVLPGLAALAADFMIERWSQAHRAQGSSLSEQGSDHWLLIKS